MTGGQQLGSGGFTLVRRPSPSLSAAVLLMHGLGFWALLVSALPVWWVGILAPLLLISLRRQLRMARLRHPRAVRALIVDAGGPWVVLPSRVVPVRLQRPFHIGPALQTLRLVDKGASRATRLRSAACHTLIVTPDNADAEARRRLRRWLLQTENQ